MKAFVDNLHKKRVRVGTWSEVHDIRLRFTSTFRRAAGLYRLCLIRSGHLD